MFNLMRRLLVWGMLAVALSACSPPDRTDLLSLPIPGVEFFPFRDESSVPLMETAAELAERFVERGAKRGINAPTLAADATTTDKNIARSVETNSSLSTFVTVLRSFLYFCLLSRSIKNIPALRQTS